MEDSKTISEIQWERVAVARSLVRWIVSTKVKEVNTQRDLAAMIGYSAPALSGFMNGKDKKGKLIALSALVESTRSLYANLARKGFPTELPQNIPAATRPMGRSDAAAPDDGRSEAAAPSSQTRSF